MARLVGGDSRSVAAKPTDFVADVRSLLVAFGGDGVIESGAKFFEPLVEDAAGHLASRDFADVRAALVDPADHLGHFVGEGLVAIAAAEAADAAEIVDGESAGRAAAPARAGGCLGRGGGGGCGNAAEQQVGQRETGGVGDAALFGTAVAEADLLHLALDQLR